MLQREKLLGMLQVKRNSPATPTDSGRRPHRSVELGSFDTARQYLCAQRRQRERDSTADTMPGASNHRDTAPERSTQVEGSGARRWRQLQQFQLIARGRHPAGASTGGS